MPAGPRNSFIRPRGFSLVELLVVIAVISVLASVLLPSLMSVKRLAESAQCKSKMGSMGVALTCYAKDWNGWLPKWRENNTGGKFWWNQFYPYLDSRDYGFSNWPELDVFLCPSQEVHYTPGSIWSYCDYAYSYWFGYEPDRSQIRISRVVYPSETAITVDSHEASVIISANQVDRVDFRHGQGNALNILFVSGCVLEFQNPMAGSVNFGWGGYIE